MRSVLLHLRVAATFKPSPLTKATATARRSASPSGVTWDSFRRTDSPPSPARASHRCDKQRPASAAAVCPRSVSSDERSRLSTARTHQPLCWAGTGWQWPSGPRKLTGVLAVFQDGHFFGIREVFAQTLAAVVNAHIDTFLASKKKRNPQTTDSNLT